MNYTRLKFDFSKYYLIQKESIKVNLYVLALENNVKI
jgi:hypothetical protein